MELKSVRNEKVDDLVREVKKMEYALRAKRLHLITKRAEEASGMDTLTIPQTPMSS